MTLFVIILLVEIVGLFICYMAHTFLMIICYQWREYDTFERLACCLCMFFVLFAASFLVCSPLIMVIF